MKLGMYTMASQPISTAYLSLCVCMCIPVSLLGKSLEKCISNVVARQRHGKFTLLSLLRNGSVNTLPLQRIHNNRRIFGRLCLWVCLCIPLSLGRVIVQAVSRWLPTAAARVRARIWSCGLCGGQSSAGAGFLRVLLKQPHSLRPV
jgi:hypothetical protein